MAWDFLPLPQSVFGCGPCLEGHDLGKNGSLQLTRLLLEGCLLINTPGSSRISVSQTGHPLHLYDPFFNIYIHREAPAELQGVSFPGGNLE